MMNILRAFGSSNSAKFRVSETSKTEPSVFGLSGLCQMNPVSVKFLAELCYSVSMLQHVSVLAGKFFFLYSEDLTGRYVSFTQIYYSHSLSHLIPRKQVTCI